MEKPSWLVSPNTRSADLSQLPLVIKTAITELSIIAVEAKRVDAIILFRSVCTARTPLFDTSYKPTINTSNIIHAFIIISIMICHACM